MSYRYTIKYQVIRIAYPPVPSLQEFGEYQEPTYTVKTIQGDSIQQLIDGYISLTLKERRPQRPDTPEEEDVQIIDSVNPRMSVTSPFPGLLNTVISYSTELVRFLYWMTFVVTWLLGSLQSNRCVQHICYLPTVDVLCLQMSVTNHFMAALQQLIRTIESAKQSVQQAPDNQQPIDDVCGVICVCSLYVYVCVCVVIFCVEGCG